MVALMQATLSADQELVERLRSGDDAAYRQVTEAMSPALFREARRWVPDDAAAQDVVQETWLAVWSSIHHFRGDAQLRTWIYQILRRRAVTRFRKDSRLVPIDETDEDRTPVGWQRSQEGDPASAAVVSEAIRETTRAFDALSPRQREVLVRHAVLDESPDGVLRSLGISEGNRRVLLHRARRRLRKEIDRSLSRSST